MSNTSSIINSIKSSILKSSNSFYKKIKKKVISQSDNDINANVILVTPYSSKIYNISKLRTPEMKFFAESNLSLNTKIDILSNEYSKIFAKEKVRNNLMRNKIKRRFKDKIDYYKPYRFCPDDYDYDYVLTVEDAKYRTIIKTSLLMAFSNATIIAISVFNGYEQSLPLTCASSAVLGILGLHKYKQLKQRYYEEDVHDLLYLLKQEKMSREKYNKNK